jgi:hypothetical protein
MGFWFNDFFWRCVVRNLINFSLIVLLVMGLSSPAHAKGSWGYWTIPEASFHDLNGNVVGFSCGVEYLSANSIEMEGDKAFCNFFGEEQGYFLKKELTLDPRDTEWWTDSIDIVDCATILGALGNLTLTKEHPSVTWKIFQDLVASVPFDLFQGNNKGIVDFQELTKKLSSEQIRAILKEYLKRVNDPLIGYLMKGNAQLYADGGYKCGVPEIKQFFIPLSKIIKIREARSYVVPTRFFRRNGIYFSLSDLIPIWESTKDKAVGQPIFEGQYVVRRGVWVWEEYKKFE